MKICDILNRLALKNDLSAEESTFIMEEILSGRLTEGQIGAILMGLKIKGETIKEIASFAKVMREKAQDLSIPNENFVDTCGTGGDQKHTFNISTVSAILAASCGVKIAKHGNKGISSKCGSADVLKELGISISISPEKSKELLKNLGISFLFAPDLHMAMKYVMPVRKSLGIRTVFNILGPLTNPAKAKKQIIGVFDENLCKLYGEVLLEMGHEEAYIVHGMEGLDEVSISAPTKIIHLKDSAITETVFNPEDLGIKKAPLSEIQGGDPKENAEILNNILIGNEKGAKRDISCLNAAFAILLGKKADNLMEAFNTANKAIDSGKALDFLSQWKRLSN